MTLELVLLVLLVVAAVWTVLARGLVGAAIGLAVTSVVLSVLLFQMHAPWAAVFELSVCAGLITVVFVSAVALTRAESPQELARATERRWRRYVALPILLVVVAVALAYLGVPEIPPSRPMGEPGVGETLWRLRPTDVLGQVLILFTGVLGVVVLFKERGNDAR
ncbi:MAG: NADH-quinone oxidoreductase subunit J [Deltaproteobacteria bacterium]|nr:NADH-quinone oxidoreductase subunit J [Deltaproteobacteria bacterium]